MGANANKLNTHLWPSNPEFAVKTMDSLSRSYSVFCASFDESKVILMGLALELAKVSLMTDVHASQDEKGK